MNQELLNLYTVLQPFFRERMGGWQEGDGYVYLRSDVDRKLHYLPKGYQDNMIYNQDGSRGRYICPAPWDEENVIRIPRTIDDFSLEAQRRK